MSEESTEERESTGRERQSSEFNEPEQQRQTRDLD